MDNCHCVGPAPVLEALMRSQPSPCDARASRPQVLAGQVERFCDAWSERGASIECHGVRGGVHVPVLFHFCHRASKVALARLRNFLSLEPQPPGGGASGDGGVGGDGGGL